MEAAAALLWIAALGVVGVAAFSIWRRTIVRVEAGEMGLVLRRGALTDRVVDPGEHTLIPFVESIERYPTRELTYMVVEEELIPELKKEHEDVDYVFVDHPLDITTSDNATANILYTLRFRLSKTDLRLIHERFGPERIQSVIRDESRHIIRLSLNEKDYTSSDLLGPSRAHVETDISERLRETLSENGFELTHFGLREPDLGELGQRLRQQMETREEHKLEQEKSKVEGEKNRRAEAKAQSEAKIEAGKVTSKAKADAEARRTQAEAEAEIEAERVKSKAEAEAEAKRTQAETEARVEAERIKVHAEAVAEAEKIQAETKRIQADAEAYLIMKRAEAEAEANKLLAKSVSEEVLRYHQAQASLKASLAAAQGWDGKLPMFSGKDTLSFLNLTSLVESLISKPAHEYQDEKVG